MKKFEQNGYDPIPQERFEPERPKSNNARVWYQPKTPQPRPEKFAAKSHKKEYLKKPDLRFDVKDINEKKRKYFYPWEDRNHVSEDEKQYKHHQKVDVYSRQLPEKDIKEGFDFHHLNFQHNINTTSKTKQKMNRIKDMQREEALQVFKNDKVLRSLVKPNAPKEKKTR